METWEVLVFQALEFPYLSYLNQDFVIFNFIGPLQTSLAHFNFISPFFIDKLHQILFNLILSILSSLAHFKPH